MDLNKNLSIKLCFECFKPKRYLKSCDWTYNFLLKDNKTGKNAKSGDTSRIENIVQTRGWDVLSEASKQPNTSATVWQCTKSA